MDHNITGLIEPIKSKNSIYILMIVTHLSYCYALKLWWGMCKIGDLWSVKAYSYYSRVL